MYADIGFGGSPLLPAPTTPAAPTIDDIDDTDTNDTEEPTNIVARLWNTGLLQLTSRWLARVMVVYVVAGVALTAALLVWLAPRLLTLTLNTVVMCWYTYTLVTLVACQLLNANYSCKRRPTLVHIEGWSVDWCSVANLQSVWPRTAWMV
ncbi:Non-structural protein 1 [Rhodococcus sp. AW25M09]|nr:Non-structural protein 1 [Rhodococcus sp. AW25M09]